MSVGILHRYLCDGVCKKAVVVVATVKGESNPPDGWRTEAGVVWCGAEACLDHVCAETRNAMFEQAEEMAQAFEAAARQELQ